MSSQNLLARIWLKPLLLLLSGAFCLVSAAFAQAPVLLPELSRESRPLQGDSLRFCLLEDASLTADFERALGQELAASLLLEATFVSVVAPLHRLPEDYVLPYTFEEIFMFLSQDCDAFLGFPLASERYPDWLTLTRPYLRTGFVTVVKADAPHRVIGDIPRDQPLGTRSLSKGDRALAVYLGARPRSERWPRFPYASNRQVFERVRDGTIAAGLVWEPAASARIAAGEPFRILPAGDLPRTHVDLGVALRANNPFLRQQLDTAIAAAIGSGTIAELIASSGLAAEPGLED